MRTIADVKKKNKEINNHWFERSTMKFFNSIIESELIADKYFITSERFEPHMPKLYSVNEALPNGEINIKSEFQEFKTKKEALTFIKSLLKNEENKNE